MAFHGLPANSTFMGSKNGLSMSGTKMDKEGFRLGNKAHPAGGSLTVPPCGHSSIAMKGIMYA